MHGGLHDISLLKEIPMNTTDAALFQSRRPLSFSTSLQLNTKFDFHKDLFLIMVRRKNAFLRQVRISHVFLFYCMFISQEFFILFTLNFFVRNEYTMFGHSVFLGMKCFGMQYTCITIHDHSGTYISFLSFIHHIHAYKFINHHIDTDLYRAPIGI